MRHRLRKIRGWLFAPVDAVAALRSVAMVMFATSALIALLITYSGKQDEASKVSDLQMQVDKNKGIDTCRAQVASAVTDATTTYLFAVGHNVEAISALVGVLAQRLPIAPALADLSSAALREAQAEVVLDAARDARVAFETKPTGGCIGEHPSVIPSPSSSSTSTTTASSTTTGTATTQRSVGVVLNHGPAATTTTTGHGTSSTRPPPPSTTTTTSAPLCSLIPPSATTIVTVPCL